MGGCCSSAQTEPYTDEDGVAPVKNEPTKGETAAAPKREITDSRVSEQEGSQFARTESMPSMLQSFAPSNIHILVCDDDRSSATLTKWLKDLDYHVTTCLDGHEAAVVLAHAAEEAVNGQQTDINAVLVDTEMQTDHGVKILDFVKSNIKTAHIPVILMSADSTPQAMDRCIRRGGSDFVIKPITRQLLLKSVRLVCEKEMEAQNSHLIHKQGDRYKLEVMQRLERKGGMNDKYNGLVSPAPSVSKRDKRHSWSMSARDSEKPRNESRRASYAGVQHALVVVVDKDLETRTNITNWLKARGTVEVMTFEQEEEALTWIRNAIKNEKAIDLVLADAVPDEANGKPSLYLLDQLVSHRATKHVPVLIMGSIGPKEMTEAVRHGCENFLNKPITKDLMLKKTFSLLENIEQKRLTKRLYSRSERYKKLLVDMRADPDSTAIKVVLTDFTASGTARHTPESSVSRISVVSPRKGVQPRTGVLRLVVPGDKSPNGEINTKLVNEEGGSLRSSPRVMERGVAEEE